MLNHSELLRRMYPGNKTLSGGVALYTQDMLTIAKVPFAAHWTDGYGGFDQPYFKSTPPLVPGRSYVVVRMGKHMGVAYRNIISANVLRFVRFEAPDEDLKHAHAETAKWALRSRKIDIEESEEALRDYYPDNPGEDVDEFETTIDEMQKSVDRAKSGLDSEKQRWRMAADRVLVFQTITSRQPEDIILKDVYSSRSPRTFVLPLHYTDVDICRDAGLPITWQHDADAVRGLNAMRLRSAAFHKRHWAASVLQRAWRKAMVDPAHLVCQRRLKAEFESMNEPLTKKQRR